MQSRHHAGVVGSGVVAEAENGVGMIEILKRHRTLADTERQRQANARRLMTHVRTIGEIVGAIGPHEELIEEGRLVGSASRRVEFSFVGACELVEFQAYQAECIIPIDRLVFIRGAIVFQRMREPALVLKLVVDPFPKLGDRVFGKEFRCDAPGGGLPGDRLCAVLAELEGRGVLWIGSRAAGTIETFRLVCLEQCGTALCNDLLMLQRFRHRFQRIPPASRMTVRLNTFWPLVAHLRSPSPR